MSRLVKHGWCLALTVFLVLGASFASSQQAVDGLTENTPAVEGIQTEPNDSPTFEIASQRDTSVEDLSAVLVPLTSDELARLAIVWQGFLRDDLETIVQENIALRNAKDEETEDAHREKIVGLTENQRVVQEKYGLVLDAWEAKGGAPDAIQTHRGYLTALTAGAVANTDTESLLRFVGAWFISLDGGLGMALRLVGFVFAGWVMMIAARIVRRMTERALERVTGLSRLLKSFISTTVYWLTFVVGLMLFLAFVGVNVTPLFAVFGGLSFILGFALQDTIGNFASGLMMMILKPFDTGDYIQAAGVSGTVDKMTVVSTRIRTFDNQVILVPNSKLWGDVITNVNASATRRVDLVFGIGYADDAALAIKILGDLVEAHGKCLKDPEPAIFVGELGDSSVNIFCRPWSLSDDYWTVWWDLTGQAKQRFDAEGISIPFPQRDVHLHHINPPEAPEKG